MVKSPCIFVCRMENDKCVGCKRTNEEIANWLNYSDKEKQKVIDRINKEKFNEMDYYG